MQITETEEHVWGNQAKHIKEIVGGKTSSSLGYMKSNEGSIIMEKEEATQIFNEYRGKHQAEYSKI